MANVIGLSKGPSCIKKSVWARPSPRKDVLNTAKAIEDAGKMTPELAAMIDLKLKAIDSKPPARKVDYDKDGHPMDGVESKTPLGLPDGGGVVINDN